MKAKQDKKDIEILDAKKTTCIEVNTPSNNLIKIFLFKPLPTRGSPVTQKLYEEREMLTKSDQRQSQLLVKILLTIFTK